MKNKRFDLIVLGGGSGGIASAVRAAKYGAKVAVVEQSFLGGTCVNLGCVPKKIMFNASMIADTIHKSNDYGFAPSVSKIDWGKLVSKRNAYIERLRQSYAQRFEQYHIKRIDGTGAFKEAHSIIVNDEIYESDHIIIATGGEPALPRIEGINHVIDSDGFFFINTPAEKGSRYW